MCRKSRSGALFQFLIDLFHQCEKRFPVLRVKSYTLLRGALVPVAIPVEILPDIDIQFILELGKCGFDLGIILLLYQTDFDAII